MAVLHGSSVAGPACRVRIMTDGPGAPFPLVTGRHLSKDLRRGASRGPAPAGVDPDLEELLSVDSTVVRAHQHAAGARKSSVGVPALVAAQDTGGTIELREFAGRTG